MTSGILLLAEIQQDFRACVRSDRRCTFPALVSLFLRSVNFRVVCLYRIGFRLRRRGLRSLGWIVEQWILGTGAEISLEAKIGPGFRLAHLPGVVIGSKAVVGRNVEIMQGVTLGGNLGRTKGDRTQPRVGDNAFIGAGAKVLGPVEIGDGAEVGANAVVLTDVPPKGIAVGVPARVIKVSGRTLPLRERPGELSDLLRALEERVDRLERCARDRASSRREGPANACGSAGEEPEMAHGLEGAEDTHESGSY